MTFLQAGLGALPRPEQDKMRETISAADFGALGDGTARTVDQWLTGKPLSRGYADLAEMRTATGIADLALTDTIDWAAITMAMAAAGELPVILKGTPNGDKDHKVSRPILIKKGGVCGPDNQRARITTTLKTFNCIHVQPGPGSQRVILKDLAVGGLNGIYGDGLSGYLDDNSVIENIQAGGWQHCFFFDGLQAIGVRFNNIRVEGAPGNGIYFRGTSMLNSSQVINPRAATCGGAGLLFENTSDQADTTCVSIIGATAEYNKGPGMKFDGYIATLISPHFEGNDLDKTGGFNADLQLSSSGQPPSTSRVHSRVTCIGGYWSSPQHPQRWGACGSPGGAQVLVLIMPTMRSSVVNTKNLQLTVLPTGTVQTVSV